CSSVGLLVEVLLLSTSLVSTFRTRAGSRRIGLRRPGKRSSAVSRPCALLLTSPPINDVCDNLSGSSTRRRADTRGLCLVKTSQPDLPALFSYPVLPETLETGRGSTLR